MKYRMAVAAVLILIVVGCIPKRYEWSPDGRWMTVLADDGLHIADADGKLTPAFLPAVEVATWFADSKRLLVATQVNPSTWNDLKACLSTQQINSVTAAADRASQAAMRYDWNQPNINWQVFIDQLRDQEQQAGRDAEVYDFAQGIGLYLRDHSDAALQKLPTDRWNELQQMNQTLTLLKVVAFDGQQFQVASHAALPTREPVELRISPRQNAALVMIAAGTDKTVCDMWLTPLDGTGAPKKLSDHAAWYPDWSPDGRDIYFVQTNGAKQQSGDFGSLSRLTLFDKHGNLIEHPTDPTDLAGLIFSGIERVRCLKDGRVIFASVEVTLPATSGDLPQKPELFCLMPGQATVTRLLTRSTVEQIGHGCWWFELSPDNTHVSIADDHGKVAVIDLDSGHTIEAQDQPMSNDDSDTGHTTVPTWRNNDELTFAAPGSDSDHWNVMLWSLSKSASVTLSTSWPAQLLTDKQPSTQPTSK